MNLAKVSANGQITVPLEVRRALASPDKVLFMRNKEGQITIDNASARAVYRAQTAFEGAAERMGIVSEEDVQTLVDEIRYGK